MSKHIDEHIPPFDDPVMEREWLAQERAMQRERLHLDSAGDDPRGRRYRLLARAMSEDRSAALPVDFAQQVAARVGARSGRPVSADLGFESALLRVLAATLVLAGGAVAMIYGQTWLPGFAALIPDRHAAALPWLLTLTGCLGASWLLGQWHRQLPHPTT